MCGSRPASILLLVLLAASTALFSCREHRAGEVPVPETLVFAGDTIPLNEPEIRERLERELLINRYWHASTAQWIRKAERWFPLIDSLLKKNGVPADFRYLVAIESGFENVSSPKGASGFWQLMEGTAADFGLLINAEIDERLDPEKSTDAACRLLLRGYKEFASWPETAVSYNIGIRGLRSVMQAQYTDSFYDLLINPESGRYLFRILAAKLILENPEAYGFAKAEPRQAYRWREEEIRDSLPDLPWWCRKNGFSYKCFRLLNPWIKTSRLHLPEGRASLKIRIPLDCRVFTSSGLPPVPALDSLSAEYRNTDASLVDKKDIHAFHRAGKTAEEKYREYLVKKGDNLSSIARSNGLSMSELLRLNPSLNGDAANLREGLVLRLLP